MKLIPLLALQLKPYYALHTGSFQMNIYDKFPCFYLSGWSSHMRMTIDITLWAELSCASHISFVIKTNYIILSVMVYEWRSAVKHSGSRVDYAWLLCLYIVYNDCKYIYMFCGSCKMHVARDRDDHCTIRGQVEKTPTRSSRLPTGRPNKRDACCVIGHRLCWWWDLCAAAERGIFIHVFGVWESCFGT